MTTQLHSTADATTYFHSEVFTGLGKLCGEYKIELKEDDTLYALSAPCRVALPLQFESQGGA